MMILRNMGKCNECGDVIESVHRHDFVRCSCGAVAVDGGKSYLRRAAKEWGMFTEMSVILDPLFFVEWPVPIMVETVLLPYKGKIIYDGMISNYPIRFKPEMAKVLYDQFVLKKSKHGIIRELPLKG